MKSTAPPTATTDDAPAAVRSRTGIREDLRDHVFSRPWALAALAAMALMYSWSFFQRVAVPGTVFNEMQTDLNLKASQVTALGAIYLYVYASIQMFVGLLTDRFGGTRVLIVGGTALLAGAIIFPLADSLWLLYASRALVGLGASVMFLAAFKEADALFSTRGFNLLIGPIFFMGGFGALLGTFPFERLVEVAGWRTALQVAAAGTGLTLLAIILLVRRLPPDARTVTVFKWRDVLLVLRNRRTIPGLFAGPLTFSVYFLAQATIGKKLLEDSAGMSSATAATVTLAMVILSMTLIFCVGFISTLLHERRRPLMLTSASLVVLASATLAVCLWLKAPGWTLVPPCLVLAISNGLSPAFVASFKELSPRQSVGFALGYVNSITYFAVALIAHGSGVVLDLYRDEAIVRDDALIYPTSAYAVMFAAMTVVALISLAATAMIAETNGRASFDVIPEGV